jgi:tetratricopeptide (TPR) repeat protein
VRKSTSFFLLLAISAAQLYWGYNGLARAAPAVQTSPTLDQVSDQVVALRKEVHGYVTTAKYVGSIGGAILAIVGFFGWSTLREFVRKVVERNLQETVEDSLDKELPKLLEETQSRAEKFLLRLAKLLALNSVSAHDDALAEFEWNGNVASLRGEAPSLRRLIVECLYGAKKNRDLNRAAAWEALSELVQEDQSTETHRLFLRLSVSMRKYQDGLTYLERHRDTILVDKESALRASTLLRKVGRVPEAPSAVLKYKSDDDAKTNVAIAVLQRDLGKFDEVHDILLPQVNRLMAVAQADLPDGWHRVVNTFVANCLDRERPEDAIAAAEFVARSAPGAVEAFTVGRLVLALPLANPARAELENKFRETVGRLVPGEATTRCKVVLAQLDGAFDRAISLLKSAIEEGTLPKGQGMKNDVYFQRCNLGQILSGLGRTEEAIDVLVPAVGFSFGGEAKFRLAIAYALQGEARDSARWFEAAILESPKWAGHARDHDALREVPEIIEKLAKVGGNAQ